jgi:NADH-quinone oxidoreductase subunit D
VDGRPRRRPARSTCDRVARGEFGCYLSSDGSPKPRRVHFRTPSFANLSAMPVMTKGVFIADLVAIIGSIDIVLGDVDR